MVMMERFDAIVVGARIAGSATALTLAARGWRVLLLDAATFPSDTLSTHLLWSDALAAFDRLGLLDAVLATGAPPLTRIHTTFGDLANEASIPTLACYPPLLSVRRVVLDNILVGHARQWPGPGAVVLREGARVGELIWAGERVVGARWRAGQVVAEASARVVVGADGRHSRIARLVGAAEYDAVPPLLATYYRYYQRVTPRAVPALEAFRDAEGGFCYLFPCDGGYWTLAVSFPQAEFPRARQDHEGWIAAQIARKPALVARLAGAAPASPLRGAGDLANFFRVPYGPGWALVGDAGYHRDPITARGIPDALASAQALADALDAIFRGAADEATALAGYQAARDTRVQPLYDLACDRAPAGVSPDRWGRYLRRTMTAPAFLSTYIGFMAGVTRPDDFYSVTAVDAALGEGPATSVARSQAPAGAPMP